jgi:hypothetical protein
MHQRSSEWHAWVGMLCWCGVAADCAAQGLARCTAVVLRTPCVWGPSAPQCVWSTLAAVRQLFRLQLV